MSELGLMTGGFALASTPIAFRAHRAGIGRDLPLVSGSGISPMCVAGGLGMQLETRENG